MNGQGILNHLVGGQRIQQKGHFEDGTQKDGVHANVDSVAEMKE
jgi:hypothetical protein